MENAAKFECKHISWNQGVWLPQQNLGTEIRDVNIQERNDL